ncbi:Homeobox-leucine zipper protein ATHB-4 [Raphanus sativus]|uniref:Homeobox-leucine zipper protein ATHB-4 n=1 Tax=Raphanus sativus TaxID=3726 RepID=A0A6J0JJR1_RAPSA|nr:homeobox-leucine zipper protein ATHB-4 [Raphanus sativus]KAJ4892340.1 Homeobox-leucine zipper protein ATHB-4 [Raphanus sativus]
MGERDDGLGLSLSLGFNQPKEPSLRLNLMPLTTSSLFPHMQNHNNNDLQKKTHHNSWPHLFASSAAERNSDSGNFLRGFNVNRSPAAAVVDSEEEAVGVSSPNSTVSSVSGNKRDLVAAAGGGGEGDETEVERASCSHGGGSGGSEDEDGGNNDGTRKKLRLSKEQALVLEETFKEHSTLNPKQKIALAKQLNLRTRQVEVWFQNRRARTKLKQTEVDCEYLKRCCDNLTEENRRLQKEVTGLRALKLSPNLYMHMTPPTTLTMCPSCERVSASSSAVAASSPPSSSSPAASGGGGGGGIPTVGRPSPQRPTPWGAISLQSRLAH